MIDADAIKPHVAKIQIVNALTAPGRAEVDWLCSVIHALLAERKELRKALEDIGDRVDSRWYQKARAAQRETET